MRFRNSLRLLIENFENSYKILLCRAITLIFSVGLCCAFLLPDLKIIATSAEFINVQNSVKAFLDVIFQGTDLTQFVENVHAALTDFVRFLGGMSSDLILSALGCVLVYLVARVADSVCYYTVGAIVNDKMDIYAETPFRSAFVKNLGSASLYALTYVSVAFLWDVLTVAACYFFFFYLSSFSNLLASTSLSITLIAVCQALKLTLTSTWLPAMTADNLSVRKAIWCLNKAERKQRNKVFSVYFVEVYLVIIVNVVAAICTFGSALIITVPTSYLLFICTQYVNYYIVKGKKYFVTYEEIEKDVSCGDTEHFFDYVIEDESQAKSEEKSTERETEINNQ